VCIVAFPIMDNMHHYIMVATMSITCDGEFQCATTGVSFNVGGVPGQNGGAL
jgi:hypothetical protein